MSWGYAPYESVLEKKEKAKRKITQLRKKGKDISPIEIEGRTIAKSWWGKAWNENISKYADFSNRLSRGRSYITHGCVIDLQINNSNISASILGSGTSVYKADIRIDPLRKNQWKKLKELVSGNISSLSELLSGKFPEEMNEILTDKKNGLFPAPKEFHPNCNCPDYSKFCKHLAAVIYGVGNRLDKDPAILFKLRGVNPNELVSEVVRDHKKDLISKAKNVKSKRVMKIADKQLSEMFDINISLNKK